MAHLIDKDALVAEIKRRMDENRGKQSLPQYFGMMEEDLNILSFIDTLEVKEMDLESEMDKYFETMEVLEHENIFEDTFRGLPSISLNLDLKQNKIEYGISSL